MKGKWWILGGLSAALVIAIGGFVLTQLTVSGSDTAAAPGRTTSPQTTNPAPAPTATTAPPSTATPDAGSQTPSADGKRYSSEVLPPSSPGTTTGLPASKPIPDPVSAPLPKTASATGSLAKGYPKDVLPVAPGSKVGASAVASQDTHLQVTLNAKSSSGVTDVVDFYRGVLARYGMYDVPAPALDGDTAVAFTRAGNSVTLTVSPIAGGTTYVLFGTFTAGS